MLSAHLRRPLAVEKGLIAACSAIDDVAAEAMKYFDQVTADAVMQEAVSTVKLVNATVSATVEHARPSQKLPGWTHVLEVNLTGNSILSNTITSYDNITHHKLYTTVNVKDEIRAHPGCYLHGVLPSDVWAPSEWLRAKRLGPKYQQHVAERRSKNLKALRNYIDCADACLEQGGERFPSIPCV